VRKSFDNPYEFIRNNNTITLNLLEAVRLLNYNPLVIVCSSSEVYGQVKSSELPIKESQKILPINPYAVSKSFQDILSQVYVKCYDLKIIITRMFSYTNARRSDLFQTSFANQIIDIKKGNKKILEHGNLKSKRSFIDIEDAMEAYWTVAKKGKIGEIYNISGYDVISVKSFLDKLIKLSSIKIKTKLNRKLLRKTDIKIQVPSSKKFFKHTGWKPRVKLEKSIINLLLACEEIKKNKFKYE
jgi:GDP-4-dehydro-6-deoxy-D-mannose reductase